MSPTNRPSWLPSWWLTIMLPIRISVLWYLLTFCWLECILLWPHISPVYIYNHIHIRIYVMPKMLGLDGLACYAHLTLVVESSYRKPDSQRNMMNPASRLSTSCGTLLLVLLLLLPHRLLCSLSLAPSTAFSERFWKMASWNTHAQKEKNTSHSILYVVFNGDMVKHDKHVAKLP